MPSRADTNQAPIVAALRAAGCAVHIESAHRGHKFDLLVCLAGRITLMEVKRRGGRLTEDELEFGLSFPVARVETVEEALREVGLMWRDARELRVR